MIFFKKLYIFFYSFAFLLIAGSHCEREKGSSVSPQKQGSYEPQGAQNGNLVKESWESLGYELIPISSQKFRCWFRAGMYVFLEYLKGQDDNNPEIQAKWNAIMNTPWDAAQGVIPYNDLFIEEEDVKGPEYRALLHDLSTSAESDDLPKSNIDNPENDKLVSAAIVHWFRRHLHSFYIENGRFQLAGISSDRVEQRLMFIMMLTSITRIAVEADREIIAFVKQFVLDTAMVPALRNNSFGDIEVSKSLATYWNYTLGAYYSTYYPESLKIQLSGRENRTIVLNQENKRQCPLIVEWVNENHYQVRRLK